MKGRTVAEQSDDIYFALVDTVNTLGSSAFLKSKQRRLSHQKLSTIKLRVNLIRRLLGLDKWIWPKPKRKRRK